MYVQLTVSPAGSQIVADYTHTQNIFSIHYDDGQQSIDHTFPHIDSMLEFLNLVVELTLLTVFQIHPEDQTISGQNFIN